MLCENEQLEIIFPAMNIWDEQKLEKECTVIFNITRRLLTNKMPNTSRYLRERLWIG